MLMIARRGLYLFHLICAPSGHGSCNDGGCAEEGSAGEREEEREREGGSLGLALRGDEIFALSPARYCECASAGLRQERRKKTGEGKREGLPEVEKG